jgi:hypothetical protein
MAKPSKTCKREESQKKSKEVEKGRHARSGDESRPSKKALKRGDKITLGSEMTEAEEDRRPQ